MPVSPSLFCHGMSVLPSALKSPVATTCHDAPGFPSPALPSPEPTTATGATCGTKMKLCLASAATECE
jgi:hypothetical protein